MAPPSMFSYFNKNQNRKSGSFPGLSQWQSHPVSSTSPAKISHDLPNRHSLLASPISESSPVSEAPPTLPPIPRVASQHEKAAQQTSSRQPTKSDDVYLPKHVLAQLKGPRLSYPPDTSPTRSRRSSEKLALRIDTSDHAVHNVAITKEPVARQVSGDAGSADLQDEARKEGSGAQGMDQYPSPKSATVAQSSSFRPFTPPSDRTTRDYEKQALAGSSERAPSASSAFAARLKPPTNNAMESDSSPGSSISRPSTSKASKSRRGLLNPVSLIRRRRTAHGHDRSDDTATSNHHRHEVPAMSLPADYDPRIRGKGVHDFNNPQPRRHFSTETAQVRTIGEASPVEEYRRRSSVAESPSENDVSDTSDDKGSESSDRARLPIFTEHFEDDDASGVQRESLADQSFLARISRRLDFDVNDFGLPSSIPRQVQPQPTVNHALRTSKSTAGAASLRNSSDQSTVRSSFSQDTKATSPPATPSTLEDHSAVEDSLDPSPIPKKGLTASASRASRFSFQFNTDSTIAEEKALEEKGKKKAGDAQESRKDSLYDDYDDQDVDDYDGSGDAGFEEEIPMIGDDEVLDNDDNVAHLNLAPAEESTWNSSSSSQPTIKASDEGREKSDGMSIGFKIAPAKPKRHATVTSAGSGGWYFDDGTFNEGSPDEQQTETFDEEVFDDPTNGKFTRPDLGQPLPEHNRSTSNLLLVPSNQMEQHDEQNHAEDERSQSQPQRSGSDNNKLSTQNLQTLTTALASIQRQPGLAHSEPASDHGWYGTYDQDGFSAARAPFEEETDYDALADDPMISEANAEILASEDADFYGREFGFYGAAATQNGEVSNGGVFCSPNDVYRSASGRNVIREPNLTPITERSEHSRRTSHASLHRPNSNYSIAGSLPAGSSLVGSPNLRDLAADIVAEEQNGLGFDHVTHLQRRRFTVGAESSVSTSPSTHGSSPTKQSFSWSPVSPDSPMFARDQVLHEEPDGQRDDHGPSFSAHRPQNKNSSPSTPSTEHAAQSFPSQHVGGEVTPRPFANHRQRKDTTSSPTPRSNRAASLDRTTNTSSTTPYQAPPPKFNAPQNLPSLPPQLLQKFAARPPASSATYAEREREALRKQQPSSIETPEGRTITSYEDDPETGQIWLVRYRASSNGDYKFLGKELSSEGAAPFD